MPDWIAGTANVNVRNRRNVSYKLQYPGGYIFNVAFGNGLLGDANYTVNEVSALRSSIADATNFGVRSQTESLENGVSIQNVVAFDESYGANVVLNLRFQNNDQELFTVPVPGPDASLFTDGGALITPDSSAAAGEPAKTLANLIRDIENLVNNSYAVPNSFSFVGGSRGTRKMTQQRNPDVITIVEPTDTDEPGPEPDPEPAV